MFPGGYPVEPDFWEVDADGDTTMRALTPDDMTPPPSYSPAALCPVCHERPTFRLQTGKSFSNACSLQCEAILDTGKSSQKESKPDPVLQVDKLEHGCYYLHHKAPAPSHNPFVNSVATVVVPSSVADELEVMHTAVKKLPVVESSKQSPGFVPHPLTPGRSIPGLRLQKAEGASQRPSGRLVKPPPAPAPVPQPPTGKRKLQKPGARLPPPSGAQVQQSPQQQLQPPVSRVPPPIYEAESTRERYQRVASTTLRAIDKGSYTYRSKNVNLQPHIKQSKDGTRFYGEESSLSSWRSPMTTSTNRSSGASVSDITIGGNYDRTDGSERTGTLVVIMKVSTIDAAKILKEMCKSSGTTSTSPPISYAPGLMYSPSARRALFTASSASIAPSTNSNSSSSSSNGSVKIGILSFASATVPGGAFREGGGGSQEESVMRVSTLFPAVSDTREGKKFYGLGGAASSSTKATTATAYTPSSSLSTKTAPNRLSRRISTATSASVPPGRSRATSTFGELGGISEDGRMRLYSVGAGKQQQQPPKDTLAETFYTNSVLYTPSVLIIFNDQGEPVNPLKVQVVSCAAVDAGRAKSEWEPKGSKATLAKPSEKSGSSRASSVLGLDLDRTLPRSGSRTFSLNPPGKPAERKPWAELNTLEDVEKQIYERMHERMARILFVFEKKGVRNIVLGAFGTGVLKNNVKDVARIWALLLAGRFRTSFDRVAFAIIAAESVVGEFQGAFESAVCGDVKGLSSDGKPLCVVCKTREAHADFVTCGLRCNERLCKEGGDPTMCDYCHRRPRQAKQRQCGKFCAEQAIDACLLCKMRPRQPGKDLCGESCKSIAAKSAPLVLEAPKWHSVFAKVEEHFKSNWKASTKPVPVVKKVFQIIESDALLTPYDAYLQRVGNEGFRFHGTKRQCKLGVSATGLCSSATCPICNILRTSFKVSTADPTSAFGPGIYTSSASNKAYSYCDKEDASRGALLLTKVVMGKSRFVNGWKEVTSCPPGFNSVVFDRHKGNLNETIVYTDNAIRPIFLIMF